jgi:CHAD domain-containing protein
MRDYVRKQTAVLLRRLAFQINRAARNGDPDAVHDLRVAIRRLSRCLQVFAQFYPGHSWKRMRRRLSDLMDACGKVRDLDIAIDLLDKAGIPRDSSVIGKLEEERLKAERELVEELRRWKGSAVSRQWSMQLGL